MLAGSPGSPSHRVDKRECVCHTGEHKTLRSDGDSRELGDSAAPSGPVLDAVPVAGNYCPSQSPSPPHPGLQVVTPPLAVRARQGDARRPLPIFTTARSTPGRDSLTEAAPRSPTARRIPISDLHFQSPRTHQMTSASFHAPLLTTAALVPGQSHKIRFLLLHTGCVSHL